MEALRKAKTHLEARIPLKPLTGDISQEERPALPQKETADVCLDGTWLWAESPKCKGSPEDESLGA